MISDIYQPGCHITDTIAEALQISFDPADADLEAVNLLARPGKSSMGAHGLQCGIGADHRGKNERSER